MVVIVRVSPTFGRAPLAVVTRTRRRPIGDANEDREQAARLLEGDLVRILLTQHATVKDMLDQIEQGSGTERKKLFTQLTTTLKAHETAEESVVRPVTKETADDGVAISDHAEAEETQEFPTIQSKRSDEERKELGDAFLSQFEAADGRS